MCLDDVLSCHDIVLQVLSKYGLLEDRETGWVKGVGLDFAMSEDIDNEYGEPGEIIMGGVIDTDILQSII